MRNAFSGLIFSSSIRPLTRPVPLCKAEARTEVCPHPPSLPVLTSLQVPSCSSHICLSALLSSTYQLIMELFAHLPAGMIAVKGSFPERNF